MKTRLYILYIILQTGLIKVNSQACTPLGDQTSYGSGDVWIGYMYDDLNFTNYNGYVNEGIAGSPNFDESFGGDYANYPTNGCATYTETFSTRYKLTKIFSDGDYEFTVGGDDGFRLSLDGGATWVINRWTDQSYSMGTYTGHLNGSYDMVLEYYENGGQNRISFQVTPTCIGTDDPSGYGTGNIWNGYVYDGMNFNTYKGLITGGNTSSSDFDESFGGSNTVLSTNTCTTQTETFSVRYRLRKNFAASSYIFIVGGDDGYRFSLDGGSTWVIDQWHDQGYSTSSYSASVSGMQDMVIEYYENSGDNRLTFNISGGGLLPINLISFEGERINDNAALRWETTANSTTDHFEIERSVDNKQFYNIGNIAAADGIASAEKIKFIFTDKSSLKNTSYYRLKLFDLSGTVTYSKVIIIQHGSEEKGVQVYPTITKGTVFVSSSEKINNPSLALYDLTGRKIAEKKLSTIVARVPVNVSFSNNAPKGMYILRVSDSNSIITTQKIILQ